jgi:hypothetical protein
MHLTPWLESLVLTVALPLVGYVVSPVDPFFVTASFPWLWFGPLLVALRYGIAPALSSIGLLTLLWFALVAAGQITGVFPLHFMLGGALLVLVAGQFSSVWTTRLRRTDQLSRHASERFERLSRAYFMVRHSHDRLEQNLISRPVTLRQAMMELRHLLVESGGSLDAAFASKLLIIIAHYCSLSSAAIYGVNQGKPSAEPLAQCGKGAVCMEDDLLLRSALEAGTTTYKAANWLVEGEQSSCLVAAPLRTSSAKTLGILLVSDMPFMMLHRETLQILGVLLAYAADQTEAAHSAQRILMVYPDCPLAFGAELVKMIHLRKDLDVTSMLAMIHLEPSPHLEELCLTMERQQRGLDHSWRRSLGWGVQFVTLMPFSGTAALEGYQARLNEVLTKQFNLTLQSVGITFKFALVSAEEPLEQLANLLVEGQ